MLRVRASEITADDVGGVLWSHYTPVPASPVHGLTEPVVWRVPVPQDRPTGHVVGWLLPAGATDVRVDVAGRPRAVTTTDGLGTVEAGPLDNVRLRARFADGTTMDRTVSPGEADPAGGNEREDLFPMGG